MLVLRSSARRRLSKLANRTQVLPWALVRAAPPTRTTPREVIASAAAR